MFLFIASSEAKWRLQLQDLSTMQEILWFMILDCIKKNCSNDQNIVHTVKSAEFSRQTSTETDKYDKFCPPSSPGDAENPSSTEPEVLEGQGSFKLEGWWLKLSQFHGLIVKRFHCAKRNTKGLFSQILLPAFFVCVAMTVALSVPEIGEILHDILHKSTANVLSQQAVS